MTTNYITMDNDFNDVKKRNFYMYEIISAFVWMCFHFTVIFFFMIRLESLMLVGLFLGFGNLVSFFVDSPIGVFQRYFKPKQIFLFGAYLMLFVSLIFVYFIFQTNSINFADVDLLSFDMVKWFFSSVINIVLLVISVTLYGIIKELSEVTSNSYIMNNSDPSEYSDLFSKRSIFFGIGSGVGLVLSGVILALNTFVAVIILVLIILFYIFFITRYFDNGTNELNLEEFKKIKLITKDLTKDNIMKSLKDYKTQVLDNKEELKNRTQNLKVIFLKPVELKDKINFKEILQSTINDLKSFILIIFQPPYNYRLLVIGGIFVIFGFWDTFVTTFLIDYIDEILIQSASDLAKYNLQNIFTAYVFVAIFCIPAFLGQIPLVTISEKMGIWKIIIPGLLLSGVSMLIFGYSEGIYVLLLAGILNGIGYAACMPISQGEFSNEYNTTYADKNKLKQIDANASSAPMKMLSNLANVIGLSVGGVMLKIFGYSGTFYLLAAVIFFLFGVSLFKGKKLKLY